MRVDVVNSGGGAEGYLGEVLSVVNIVELGGIHGGPGMRLQKMSRVWLGQSRMQPN